MMKLGKNFRRALTLAVVAVMLVGTAAAASVTTKKMIEANYSGIKLVVDGVEVSTSTEPFISEGTTYLPVRAVGEALGKDVKWDGQNRIVYIGQIPGTADNWMTKLPPYKTERGTVYDGSDRKASFSVAGVDHTIGLTLMHGNWSDQIAYAIWNTNGEYKTMTLTIGALSDAVWDGTLEVYLDGEYSTEYELKWDSAPKTISIPLNYAPNVKLLDTNGNWGIYDISFS